MKQLGINPNPELKHALNSLEIELSTMDDRDVVVLSDFDKTLCDRYTFDVATNNHLALIDPEVIDAAQAQQLIVATSRRTENPTIPLLWSSGLVQPNMPLIVENGGAILWQSETAGVESVDLVRPEELEQLSYMSKLITESVCDLPDGQNLIMKTGRALLLARLQDQAGNALPEHQHWLAERIREVLPSSPPSPIRTVDTRASVTIQHASVTKGRAFRAALNALGISRDDIYVVGMGDGPNDRELFEEADLSLGFSDAVTNMVDIEIPTGHQAAAEVLTIIGRSIAYARQAGSRNSGFCQP